MAQKNELYVGIGNRIKERRLELDFSQEELAGKIGYSDRSVISNYESGKRILSYATILKLSEALRTNPAWLMGESTDINCEEKDFNKKNCEYTEILDHGQKHDIRNISKSGERFEQLSDSEAKIITAYRKADEFSKIKAYSILLESALSNIN